MSEKYYSKSEIEGVDKCPKCGGYDVLMGRIGEDRKPELACGQCMGIGRKYNNKQKYDTITDTDGTKVRLKDGRILRLINDPVNHPPHYTHGSIECIEVIEDWKLPYHLGNAIKYICRTGKKNDIFQDIDKAIWYLNRYKEFIKKSPTTNDEA